MLPRRAGDASGISVADSATAERNLKTVVGCWSLANLVTFTVLNGFIRGLSPILCELCGLALPSLRLKSLLVSQTESRSRHWRNPGHWIRDCAGIGEARLHCHRL